MASSNFSLLYQTPSEVAGSDSVEMGYRGFKAVHQSRLEMSHPNFTQSEFHPCGLLPHPRSGLTTLCASQQHLYAPQCCFISTKFECSFLIMCSEPGFHPHCEASGLPGWPVLPCSGICLWFASWLDTVSLCTAGPEIEDRPRRIDCPLQTHTCLWAEHIGSSSLQLWKDPLRGALSLAQRCENGNIV